MPENRHSEAKYMVQRLTFVCFNNTPARSLVLARQVPMLVRIHNRQTHYRRNKRAALILI